MMESKTDIELWHKMRLFASELKKVASFRENEEINRCRFYEFDGAYEEVCHNAQAIDVMEHHCSDFDSKDECWKCRFRVVKT